MIEARHMNRTSGCEDALASATQSLDAWLVQNLDHFSPFGLDQGDKLCYKLKAFDELCMYSAIADERDGVPIPREVHDFVTSVCVNPRYLSTIVSSPRELLLYIYPIIYMVQKQLPSWREMRAYALSVISSDLYFSTERLPCRILDSLFCLWQLDPGNEKLSLFENAWSVGSGAHPPHAAWSTATEYYSYTHSIFFGTKLGLDSHGHGGNGKNEQGEDAIELGILRFLSEQNIDLALELVLCQMLLKHKNAIGGSALCLSHLFADIKLHGYVAGPTPVGVELFSNLEKNWFCNYHTSLVAALVLRYARARYMPNLVQSLKELETSNMKLSALCEVGSIFRRMASGEVTCSGAQAMLVDVQRDFGPELALRIERYLSALPGFI
jgi:hypothetical protein